MKSPAFKSEEKQVKKPLLIVDRVGVIGKALSEEFSKDYIVFFATKKSFINKHENIIFIPFSNKIPRVPDNQYTKIFIIDDGEVVTRESVSSFLKKAKQIGSPIYFLGSIRNIDLEHSDEVIKSYPKAKVLIFGDLFDNEILFDKKSSVTKFIIESRKNKKIKVLGDGLSLNYPISFKDSIKLIVKATYIDVPERAILLFARHPITDISLANTFQKIDPDIGVDFEKNDKRREFYFPKNSQYALAKYDLQKKLSEINLENSEREIVESGRGVELRFVKPILFFLLACFFLLLLPLLTTYGYMFLGDIQLSSAKESAEKGDFEESLKKTKNAERFYNFANQTAGVLEYQTRTVGKEELTSQITTRISMGSDLSKAGSSLLEGVISFENLSSGKTKDSVNEINNAVESFKKANVLLQQLNVSGQIPESFSENVKNILPVVSVLSDSSEALPDLFGFNKEKNYLIVFSDNNELRPGGGVVGSVGVLKIKNGKVNNFEMIESNVLDQKLKGLIESPFYLRRHLPTERLTLRDSLSNPDFVTSAINASSVYELGSEARVDGVIGLNLELFKSINEIYKNEKPEYFSILGKIGQGIREKEVLLAFKDPATQSIFIANNLAGSLIDQRENDSLNDYFGIAESNLGKNKISHKISRSVTRKLMVNEQRQLVSEIKISFKNNGEGNDSTYKNYLSLILPVGSKIQEVSVGGRKVNVIPAITDPGVYERKGFVPPIELEVEELQEQEKSMFGFLVLIPPQSARTITINYTLPFSLPESDKNLKYSLIVFKQPGIKSYSFSQSFDFPQNFSILPSSVISKEIRNDEKFDFLISEK